MLSTIASVVQVPTPRPRSAVVDISEDDLDRIRRHPEPLDPTHIHHGEECVRGRDHRPSRCNCHRAADRNKTRDRTQSTEEAIAHGEGVVPRREEPAVPEVGDMSDPVHGSIARHADPASFDLGTERLCDDQFATAVVTDDPGRPGDSRRVPAVRLRWRRQSVEPRRLPGLDQ